MFSLWWKLLRCTLSPSHIHSTASSVWSPGCMDITAPQHVCSNWKSAPSDPHPLPAHRCPPLAATSSFSESMSLVGCFFIWDSICKFDHTVFAFFCLTVSLNTAPSGLLWWSQTTGFPFLLPAEWCDHSSRFLDPLSLHGHWLFPCCRYHCSEHGGADAFPS